MNNENQTVIIVPHVSVTEAGTNVVVKIVDKLTGEVLYQFARFWKLKGSTSRRYALEEAFEWCCENEIDRVLVADGSKKMSLI